MNNRPYLPAFFLLLSLVALSCLSIYLLRPPQALAADAPAADFSAARAMRHVSVIAREPHAIGTPAHEQVRKYLLAELNKLNIPTQVQATVVSNAALRRSAMAYVQNVVGVIKGSGQGKAVLVMAHYDSQPNTFGAGDDGAGVAALLETARALRSGPPLRNDVIFLLTDGEEFGLFGARAFLRHPLAKNIGVVINLEGRGNSGPSLTFEISPENGWLVAQFSKAAPFPLASSLMYEIYRRLPNDTDFSVFRQAGYSGLNSAFIDGYVHYHKLTDRPENLNPNSLQHHGSNTLGLVRQLGNISLQHTKAPDKIFFNPIGKWFIQYPASYNIFWLLITGCAVLALLVIGKMEKAFSIWQLSKGFVFYILMVILVAGLFIILNQGVVKAMPFHRFINGVYGADLFSLAYVLIALGLFLLLSHLVLKFTSIWGLSAGTILFIFAQGVAVYLTVPAAAYILLFPVLFFCLGGIVVLLLGWGQPFDFKNAGALLLGFLPALFLLVPLALLTLVSFALQLPIVPILVLLLLWGLGLPLLHTIIAHLFPGSTAIVPLLLLFSGGLLTGWAIYAEKYNEKQPMHSEVGYYLDADKEKAFWASGYTTPDYWNKQFFSQPKLGPLTEIFPVGTQTFLKNPAPVIQAPGPIAEVILDTIYRGHRTLKLQLRSVRQAAHLQIFLLTRNETAMIGASINGEKINNPKKPVAGGYLLSTMLFGLPSSKQLELKVQLQQTESLRLFLYDRSIGLPDALIKIKRPADVIPEQGLNSNITVIKKSYVF
ncbi:MAG: hypothetical protein JWQ14_2500 [Adhaeribacter sp.]|nr:hypothetical protein [Adhaeribacter sp.]